MAAGRKEARDKDDRSERALRRCVEDKEKKVSGTPTHLREPGDRSSKFLSKFFITGLAAAHNEAQNF